MISDNDLKRWKINSIEIAKKLHFKEDILNFIENNVRTVLNQAMPPKEMWYGWCLYEEKQILVYYRNLSTENIAVVLKALRSKGVSEETIEAFAGIYDEIGSDAFFEIYNQSGMDHELIGHMYNNLAGRDCSEEAAVNVQIKFARARGGTAWKKILKIMPIVLGYHKGIDALKK